MNREIKFRGMDEDGKWHYGYYAKTTIKETEVPLSLRHCLIHHVIIKEGNMYYVKDETVCQFTGLLDKNNVEIYEDDVIESISWDRPHSKSRKSKLIRYVVKWDKGFDHSEKHISDNPRMKNNPSLFNTHPQFNGEEIIREYKYRCGEWSCFSDCEIKGNVHDNLELLKGEKE